MATASIITIGDELLIGQVTDTNSGWIAAELNKIGIRVLRRVAVGDDAGQIEKALNEESAQADVILITGGLGPTADDITKPLLCRYFGGKMIMNEEVLSNIRHLFEKIYKRPTSERNIKQAEVPDTCTVIMNYKGTAPGMWFTKDNTIFFSMPGVPNEMMGLMETALPLLKEKLQVVPIYHRTLVTAGIGESVLADRLVEFEEQLPPFIKLAYLPRYGMVRLRLTASGKEDIIEKTLDRQFEQLQSKVTDVLVTNKDEPMEAVLGNLLLSKKKTISTAESCTGGYISHLLTSQPGSSAYVEGGVVAYSYFAKEDLLGVNEATLTQKGAVSREVVLEMANGALEHLKTDYVIAVSGIMGPGGGTPEKPVGTVWVALGKKGKLETHQLNLRFDRKRNVEMTALLAMNHLRKFILSDQ